MHTSTVFGHAILITHSQPMVTYCAIMTKHKVGITLGILPGVVCSGIAGFSLMVGPT